MIKGLQMFDIKGMIKTQVFGTLVQETPSFYTVKKHVCKNNKVFGTYNTCIYKDDINYILKQESAVNKAILGEVVL